MAKKNKLMFETESLRATWSEYDGPIGDKIGTIDFERRQRDLMGEEYWSYVGSSDINKYRGNSCANTVESAASVLLFHIWENGEDAARKALEQFVKDYQEGRKYVADLARELREGG